MRSGLPLYTWLYSCWDAIDKINVFKSFKKDKIILTPNAALKANNIIIGLIHSPSAFLPLEQKDHVVNTQPMKKKLDVRAIQAQYLRAVG